MKAPKAIALTCLLALVTGCDLYGGRRAQGAHLGEVCSAALPGTDCDLLVSDDGKSRVVSHCHQEHDGSLVCSTSDDT
jgi:hypothetical protein